MVIFNTVVCGGGFIRSHYIRVCYIFAMIYTWMAGQNTKNAFMQSSTMTPQSTNWSWIADAGGLYHFGCH